MPRDLGVLSGDPAMHALRNVVVVHVPQQSGLVLLQRAGFQLGLFGSLRFEEGAELGARREVREPVSDLRPSACSCTLASIGSALWNTSCMNLLTAPARVR